MLLPWALDVLPLGVAPFDRILPFLGQVQLMLCCDLFELVASQLGALNVSVCRGEGMEGPEPLVASLHMTGCCLLEQASSNVGCAASDEPA